MDLLYWSRHFRNMPGEGDLPVTDFMRAVAATGYDGPLSLEIFNDQFRGGSPKSIAVDGRRSLIYLMDQVARAEPAIAIDVPAMPERIDVGGVEFVEFAADETEAEELAAAAAAMGFSLAARHRNKDVTLYRQGGINIVVNTEKEGLAHSSYLVHGTSAYAFGLKVEDAAATVARARALGAEPFEQRHGPGELAIPAIRGVGGGVIYFIDGKSELAASGRSSSSRSTTAAGDAGPDRDRPRRADDELRGDADLAALLHLDLPGRRKSPMVDVVDPAGLVRSQVVESDGGGLRLTLNGAENRKTLAGHFIAESFGSGVQHLAFASRDIFRDRRPAGRARLRARWRFRRTTMTISKRASASSRNSRAAARPKHPLRPRRRRRVFPALQPELRRGVLLRDRRAPRRLQRLRRAQCPVPHRRPEADAPAKRHAKGLTVAIATYCGAQLIDRR